MRESRPGCEVSCDVVRVSRDSRGGCPYIFGTERYRRMGLSSASRAWDCDLDRGDSVEERGGSLAWRSAKRA